MRKTRLNPHVPFFGDETAHLLARFYLVGADEGQPKVKLYAHTNGRMPEVHLWVPEALVQDDALNGGGRLIRYYEGKIPQQHGEDPIHKNTLRIGIGPLGSRDILRVYWNRERQRQEIFLPWEEDRMEWARFVHVYRVGRDAERDLTWTDVLDEGDWERVEEIETNREAVPA